MTSPHAPKTAAFFDVDGTLVKRDSLLPFIAYCVGWPRALVTFVKALLRPLPGQADLKGAVKAAWLINALAGVPLATAEAAARRVTKWRVWKEPAYSALLKHKRNGASIIIATGALSLYVPYLLEGLPLDVTIATEMEVVDGKLTGRMTDGNCVRAEKARRVDAYIKTHGPFARTYGYGNAPSDLPMLALLDETLVI